MEHDAVDEDIDQVVPGGWRRAVFGLALGAVAGLAIGLVLPRDDGRASRSRRADPGVRNVHDSDHDATR